MCLLLGIQNPYYIFLTAATILTLTEIITVNEFLSGFSNEGLITIAILFGIVKPVSRTGILQFISEKVLVFKKFPRISLLTIMIVVAFLSIFFNNTPIVALFIPIIKDWCRKNNFSPSKFLIPLSYATIAGGMCSLLGTSTNLLVHGFLKEIQGQEGFGFFEIGYVGFPCCFFLISYLFIFSFICLPANKGGLFRLLKKGKTFISEVIIKKNSYLKGKTVSKIKQNYNVEFIEIIRKKHDGIERIVPVPLKEIIELNDTLIVSGDMDIIMDMIHDSNEDEEQSLLESFQKEESINIVIEKSKEILPPRISELQEELKKETFFLSPNKPRISYSDVDLKSLSERNDIESFEKRRSLDLETRPSLIKNEPRKLVSSTLLEELNTNVKKIREINEEEEEENLKHLKSEFPIKIQTIPSNDPISQFRRIYNFFCSPFKRPKFDESNTVEYFEVVIGGQSRAIGSQVKDGIFQSRYNASIIAIRRNSESRLTNLEGFQFKTGDTVLILAKSTFFSRWIDSDEFFVISRCNRQNSTNERKNTRKIFGKSINMNWVQYFSIPIFIGMIVAATTGVSMFKCALISLVVMIFIGIIDSVAAYQSVDWGLIILIACSFAIGKGIQNSGLAAEFSNLILRIPFPKFILPSILFLMTQVMSAAITNNAAAAIVFPFAVSLSKSTGIAIKPFAVAVAIGASAEFSTPIGYQTNLMVQGPGGYRFLDYTKIGLPLNFSLFIISGILIPIIYEVY